MIRARFRDWFKLNNEVSRKNLTLVEKEKAISHSANILGRTFEEVLDIYLMHLVQ
jgi:hypothetical protein